MAEPITAHLPKAGEKLMCEQCGMEIRIEKDCASSYGEPLLECCGQPLTRA
jgi:hypothetical protein